MKLPVFKPRERRHLLLSPVVCFYKGQIPPNAPGGGLTTFDRLLSPNQGRFTLIKVKSPNFAPGGGGGVSRNNDRRIKLQISQAVERVDKDDSCHRSIQNELQRAKCWRDEVRKAFTTPNAACSKKTTAKASDHSCQPGRKPTG